MNFLYAAFSVSDAYEGGSESSASMTCSSSCGVASNSMRYAGNSCWLYPRDRSWEKYSFHRPCSVSPDGTLFNPTNDCMDAVALVCVDCRCSRYCPTPENAVAVADTSDAGGGPDDPLGMYGVNLACTGSRWWLYVKLGFWKVRNATGRWDAPVDKSKP